LASHGQGKSQTASIPIPFLREENRKTIFIQNGSTKTGQAIYGILENSMKIYLPFVAQRNSPARRLAPRPFRSFLLRFAANQIAAFSALVSFLFGNSGAGAGTSSEKSYIDHEEDFIERSPIV
jgi:hypothetical protein